MSHFGAEQPMQKFAVCNHTAANAGANGEVDERIESLREGLRKAGIDVA